VWVSKLMMDGEYGMAEMWLADLGVNQNWTNQTLTPRLLGDVNGDYMDDIIAFSAMNGTWVYLSNGTNFTAPTQWLNDLGIANGFPDNDAYPRLIGDVTGDGMADVVVFEAAGVYVAASNGTAFNASVLWLADFGISQGWTSFNNSPRVLADVNGDKFLDILGFNASGTYIALNMNGTSFALPTLLITDFGTAQNWTSFQEMPRFAGDVDGDKMADIIGFQFFGPVVSYAENNGTLFTPEYLLIQNLGWL